jgi:ATP-dependent protease ClpP protease subunit
MSESASTSDLQLLAQTEGAEVEAHTALLKLVDRLASSAENREYMLEGSVGFAAIRALIDQVEKWVRIDNTLPVRIVMNVQIMSFIDAIALHDFLRWVRQQGVKVIIQVSGMAYGQAVVVLRAADEVYVTERSWIHITEVRGGTSGNSYQAEERLGWVKRLQEQQYDLLESRKLSRKVLREKIYLKTWSLDARDAVKFGFANAISSVLPASLVNSVSASLGEGLSTPTDLSERKVHAEIRTARAKSRLSGLELRATLAEPARHGVVRFINEVSEATALTAKNDLTRALRSGDGDLTLLIDSNGGSCNAGFGFIDLCMQVQNSGRVINTEVIGYAASMGGVMLQLGKKRVMGKNSWLLIHRVSSSWGDTMSEFELGLEKSMNVQRQCFEFLAARSILTADEILERCRTSDWWLTAEEALKYRFIDEIR